MLDTNAVANKSGEFFFKIISILIIIIISQNHKYQKYLNHKYLSILTISILSILIISIISILSILIKVSYVSLPTYYVYSS